MFFVAQGSSMQFNIGDLASKRYNTTLTIKVYTNKVATELPVYVTVTEPSGRYDIKRVRLDPSKLALNVPGAATAGSSDRRERNRKQHY